MIPWTRPLPCSLHPVSCPRRDSRWRGHIDFKPRANGQPSEPCYESPFISWSGKPSSQPTSQPTYLPTNRTSNHRNDLPTVTTTTRRGVIANKPKPPWSTLVRGARLLILRAVDSFSMNTMPRQIISNMKTGKSTSASAVPLLDITDPSWDARRFGALSN